MAVNCNGASFTTPGPASYASCQNAFSNTPGGGIIQTIGDRAAGDWYMALPQRFMSGKRVPSLVLSRINRVGDKVFELTPSPDDGLCVIDYDVARPGQMDHSSLSRLQAAAHAVLGVCVENLNKGGVATGLGSFPLSSIYLIER